MEPNVLVPFSPLVSSSYKQLIRKQDELKISDQVAGIRYEVSGSCLNLHS